MTALDPNQTWKLIHPDGHVIGQGSMSSICEHILDTQTRNDSLSLIEQAAKAIGVIEQQEQSKRELDLQRSQFVCDSVTRLAIRLDSYIQRRRQQRRLDARRQAKADAEAKAARIKHALDALNGHTGEPSEAQHNGELTTHPPGDPFEEQITATGPAADKVQRRTSDQGDLPAELELDPPEEPPPGAKQSTARNPVAVSLNEDDDD